MSSVLSSVPDLNENEALCYHCDASVNYDELLAGPDIKCAQCGLVPFYQHSSECDDYIILICEECNRMFSRHGHEDINDHKYSMELDNCPRCDPNTEDMKYVHDAEDGWLFLGYRTECVICENVDYAISQTELPRFCINCNPQDSHNQYKYMDEIKSYLLVSIYVYFANDNKHRWTNPYPIKYHDCLKCDSVERFSIEDKIYVKYAKENDDTVCAVIASNKIKNSKKKLVVVESADYLAIPTEALASYTGVPLTVAKIIIEYRGTRFSKTNLDNFNLNKAQYCGMTLTKSSFVGADLSKANFKKCNLKDANFMGANLKGVSFEGAKLDRVNFAGANLRGAIFTGLQLIGVNFAFTDLTRTDFTNVVFSFVSFTKCTMNKTLFTKSKMLCVNMNGADINKCNFDEIEVKNSILSGLHYVNCNFTNSKFINCRLTNTNLEGNNLQGMNMRSSWINKANLSRANLSGAKITNVHCDSAICEETILTTAHITGLHFKKCNFTRANFNDATLQYTDMRRALLDEATFEKTKLCLNKLEDADTQFKGAILILDKSRRRR